MASLRPDAGGHAAAAGRVRARRAADARRRARADRRDGLVVVRDPRLPAPGARRSGHRPARPHGARDVRRAHARAGDPAGGAAHGLDRARPRVLRRLRLGVGRGRDQARAAGLARRAHEAADLARRLPRRHVRRDGRVRPRVRHAQHVARRARRSTSSRRCRAGTPSGSSKCARCSHSTSSPA